MATAALRSVPALSPPPPACMHDALCVVVAVERDAGVKVVLRARPLNALENMKTGGETCITCEGDTVACKVAKGEHAGSLKFSFDSVFGPDSTQKQVYDFVGPIAIQGAWHMPSLRRTPLRRCRRHAPRRRTFVHMRCLCGARDGRGD
jgi:hypothetical protein